MLFLKKQPPGRLIVLGFALVILLGTGLLLLPVSVRDDVQVSFIDALFTSTSAVCVTGLIAIDVADHFTAFGQTIVAALIQIGGLGVTSIGVGLIGHTAEPDHLWPDYLRRFGLSGHSGHSEKAVV